MNKILPYLTAIGIYASMAERGFTLTAVITAVAIGILAGEVVSELKKYRRSNSPKRQKSTIKLYHNKGDLSNGFFK